MSTPRLSAEKGLASIPIISKLTMAFVRMGIRVIDASWRNGSKLGRAFLWLYENIRLIKVMTSADGKNRFLFHILSDLTLARANALFGKEPETIEWIDSFAPGSVFYDIGANMGVFTIYAGVRGKAATVFAFEPESSNYALLNRNVAANGLENRVTCLNIAFSDNVSLDYLRLSGLEIGSARHCFGGGHQEEAGSSKAPFKQGAISYSIDRFIETFNPPFPNYIKVDVDGLEDKILSGAAKTLKDPRMKSLLIEIDENAEGQSPLADQVISLGYTLLRKTYTQLLDSGDNDRVCNCIFTRQEEMK